MGTEDQRVRILVADDDPILRELAVSSLEGGGYAVKAACDGAEAVDKLRQHTFDLVITDLSMPKMDGFGVIHTIRSTPAIRHLPVIVITTHDDMEMIERAYQAGATSFVAKPLNWALFAHLVRYVLRASQQEAELREAMGAAEKANELKSNLLGVVTHEFRTPLHSVLGFAELLMKQPDGPLGSDSYKQYAQHIHQAGERLNAILSDMLLFSRAVSDDLTLQEDPYPVAALIQDAVQTAQPSLARHVVEVATASECGDVELMCDRGLFIRAMGHLLDNAAKFSPEGSTIRVGAEAAPNGELVCVVQDQGPGIDPDTIKHVMEPFVQGDMSASRCNEGLGIGLTLGRFIAEVHEGSLRLQSSSGRGTTAALLFPADRVTGAPALARTAANS